MWGFHPLQVTSPSGQWWEEQLRPAGQPRVCAPSVMSALPSSPGFSSGHSSTALSRVSGKLAQLCSQSWASGNRFSVGQSFTITSRW